MKGFIELTKSKGTWLISLNAIAIVSMSADLTTRIQLLARDKNGEMEKFFVEESYLEVLEKIKQAQ